MTAIDLVPAVYMDLVTSATTRFYIVPKYVNRSVTVTDDPDESIDYIGGSVGFRWGLNAGVFVEYTMLQGNYTPTNTNISTDVNLSQLAFGAFF